MRIVGYAIVLGVVLMGCSSRQTIDPELSIEIKPNSGDIHTAELGDAMLTKKQRFLYDGIETFERVEYGLLGGAMLIEPQTLRAIETDTHWTYYYAERFMVNDLGWREAAGGLKVSKKDPKKIEIFTHYPIVKIRAFVPKPIPRMEFKEVTSAHDPSFEQELIYNGLSGSTIKFIYREFHSDFIREPFTQEIQYDLNQQKVIGFKRARIEVIEATNTLLKYKVLDQFPDNEEIQKRDRMRRPPDDRKPFQQAFAG